jgi:hypothetical protein
MAISRPQGPAGKWTLRGCAVVVALAPYLFWMLLTMVPGLNTCRNGRTFIVVLGVSVAVLTVPGGMYWWSFYERPAWLALSFDAIIFYVYLVLEAGFFLSRLITIALDLSHCVGGKAIK